MTPSQAWKRLAQWLDESLGCGDDLDGILFLIGLQETSRAYEPNLDKASKQKLVTEGTYCVFECLGYYDRVGMETDGFWIWEPRSDLPTQLSTDAQEALLREAILCYFKSYIQ